ncbi:MAG: alpha/beta hydrolase-fold protein [Acidobacteriota bacterium]|nr:alpha/beta hydrolase-fold protein [Acidobacteriota bacterium]MDH3785673.1 alpha/beta hydrolase-fold protein [Acidobacteriota bacterium]
MQRIILAGLAVFLAFAAIVAAPVVTIEMEEGVVDKPVDGRLLLIVSERDRGEPRQHVSWGMRTAQIFGVDVDDLKPGQPIVFDEKILGHPLDSLKDIPAGEYHLQAVLHVYETFQRADGKRLKLPADNGEGQDWSRSPGNLYSEPRTVTLGGDSQVSLSLTQTIPPIEPVEDTKYVRRLRMKSEMLTEFWGTPIYISAIVLLPEGFDEETEMRYPVLYNQGHFPSGVQFFRETPPDETMRGGWRRWVQSNHEFYQHWISGRVPKMVVVLTQHATPYYDDSYGINSANTGPYGDALIHEFYPYVEEQVRGIGESWSRVVYGGSTGGWMSLAQQIFYPEFFGGVWSYCPDPVDFHAFQLIDVYDGSNAYFAGGSFKKVDRPLGRQPNGMPFITVRDFDRHEEVLGTRGRSGGQLDAFHAAFGPVAEDGYPAELWEPQTGKIDPDVARYWRENFDLNAYLQRHWKDVGPSLVGKIHLTMGTKDTFYLETAATMLEEFLESTAEPDNGPYYAGEFDYGDNEPHCYTGVPDEKGLHPTLYQMLVFAEHIRSSAPESGDMSWWP